MPACSFWPLRNSKSRAPDPVVLGRPRGGTLPASSVLLPRRTSSGAQRTERASADEHAIAVAVKAVTRADGVLVGPQNKFPPGKSGDQSQQARPRQVKVRQQLIHNPKFESRRDKNLCLSFAGLNGARLSRKPALPLAPHTTSVSGVFERTDNGCPHGQDSPCVAPGALDGRGRGFGDLVGLAMHVMALQFFRVDGLKCSQTHLESDLAEFNSSSSQARHDLRREVQAGGGRGGGTGFPREYGLVALPVGGLVGPVNIRWQGRVTQALDGLADIALRTEAQAAQAVVASANHLGL